MGKWRGRVEVGRCVLRQGGAAGRVSLSRAVLPGVGPGARASLVAWLHPLGPGRGRGAEKPLGSGLLRATPPSPSPIAVGSAAQGDVGPVAPPGPAVRSGGLRPRAPGSPLPPCPFLPVDLGTEWIERGDSLAEEREKRSTPCRFCKIAVTTLCPGVWVGKGKNQTLKMGT